MAITDEMIAVRLGALQEKHRGRLREILDATAVFRPDEVSVALELFDERLRTARVPAEDGRAGLRTLGGRDALPARGLDYEFIGAFDDRGDLIGYACFGPTPGTDRTYDLYWLVTHPTAQGRGTGSRLLGEVERRIRDRKGRFLVVETSSRDDYALTHRFYAARGYTEAARLYDFYAPKDDRVMYTKRLDQVTNCPQSEVRSP